MKGIIIVKHAVLDNLTTREFNTIQKILIKSNDVSFIVNTDKNRI